MIGSKKLMHFLGCFVSIFVIAFFVGLFFDINPISAGDESYIQLDVGTPGVGPVGWAGFKWEDLEGNSGFVMSDGNGIIQIPVDLWENRFELNEGDIGKRFYVSQNCTNFRHSELECDTANVIIDIVADSLGKPVTSMRYENGGPVQFFAGDSEYIFNDNLKPVPKYIQLYVGLYSEKINNYGPFSGGYVIGEDELGNVGGYSSNAEGLVKIPADFIGERYELTGSDIGKTFYVSQDCDNFAYNQYDDTLDVDESFVCDDALVKIKIEDNNSGDIVVLKYKKEYGEWNLFENDSGYIFMNIIEDTAGFIKMDVGIPGLGAFKGGRFVYEDLEGNSGFVMPDEDGIIQIPVDYTSGGMIYRDELNESDIGKTFYIHQYCDDFDYDNLICDTSVVRIDIVSNTAGDPVASYHYVSGKLSGDLVKFSDLDSKYIFNNEVCGSAEIKAKLTSENNVLQTGIFEFVLKEDGTTIATARNNTNGNIIFEKMKYTIPGTYIYTISQNGCPVGYVCDSGEIEVQVNVVDNGDGTFATSTMYSRGGTNSPDYNEFPFQNTPVYTATFEANGADSIGADVITGATITLPSITRLRYLALGWSTDSGATVAEYAVGENITLTEDIVLYAITKPLTATFLPGQTVNKTLKSLATGATVTNLYGMDTLIQQIVRTGTIVPGFATGLLSTNDSETPIIAWFDDGILYYYSDADILYLNQNSNYMFYGIKSGTYIDTSGWNTISVINMQGMFGWCSSLTGLDVDEWNTSSVTYMSYMFYGCSSLIELDLSNWDTSSVTDMISMFSNCSSLTNLDLNNWDTSSVTSMQGMFEKCTGLTGLHVNNWDTSKVTNMSYMFDDCSSLMGLDVGGWDTSNVTNMGSMFYNCSSLTELDVSNWDTSSVTNMQTMFYNCRSLTGLDAGGWDTSSVTNMDNMFYDCNNLAELDVSNFDTSKVTNMQSMFNGCSSLTGLDVSDWDTSSVTNMGSMFYNCSSLTELDVSNWDTSSVTNMGDMFYNCSSLTGLDVREWDTSNVTNMIGMFQSCSSLTELDVSNWNTSEVTNMWAMFADCSSLTLLDVSRWNTSSVKYTVAMFYSCSKLKTIYASTGFITSGVVNSENMFNYTPKLIGGHGTKSPSLGTTKSGAVLDSESQSGYLTYDIAVSYRTRSGVELARQIIDVGDTTVAPSIIRTGYAVSGWYTDTGFTTLFDFSQSLRKYTELYVMWKCDTGYTYSNITSVCEIDTNNNGVPDEEEKKYIVTFDSNGGTPVPSQYILSGNQIATMITPTRTGSIFEGWYYSGYNNYYVIDYDDANYPKGCNTEGLDLSWENCLLKIYLPNSYYTSSNGFVYVAPYATEKNERGSYAPGYCSSLHTAGLSWEIPISNIWTSFSEQASKIKGFSLSNAYRFGKISSNILQPRTDVSCNKYGCSREDDIYLRVRCISRDSASYFFGIGLLQKYSGEGIIKDTELVAGWSCMTGYVLDAYDVCRDPVATFEENGADSIGANVISGQSITLPNINRSGGTVLGWSTNSGSITAEYHIGETVMLTGDITFYAITSEEASATFKPNGNLLDGGNTDIVKSCMLYNTNNTCQVTTPSISNIATPEIVGYTLNSEGTTHADIGSDMEVDISGGEVYYAQTAKYVEHTATFLGDTPNYEVCDGTVFNGDVVPNSCTVIAPPNQTSSETFYSTVSGVDLITICGSIESDRWGLSGEACITMMDRNLGATTNDINDEGSYGYYYQWGNNYGFSGTGELVTSNQQVDCSPYGVKNQYTSGVFIVGNYNRCQEYNYGMWGGGDDGDWNNWGYPVVNPDDRQGPCPEGYHVSTPGEWIALFHIWSGKISNWYINDKTFQLNFKIPFAGNRSLYDTFPFSRGTSAYLHTTTVMDGGYQDVYLLSIEGDRVSMIDWIGNSTDGIPIRCFKNVPESRPTDGNDNKVFLGWTTESGSNIVEYEIGDEIILTGDQIIYAVTECADGYELNGSGECVLIRTYTVNHYTKNPGVTGYSLYMTESLSGIETQVELFTLAKYDIDCVDYSSGSLTGDTTGPGPIVTEAVVASDGTTVINLYYERRKYYVDLQKDQFTSSVEGAGTYECGQEVQIRAYPIDGYHFDMWEGEVD